MIYLFLNADWEAIMLLGIACLAAILMLGSLLSGEGME